MAAPGFNARVKALQSELADHAHGQAHTPADMLIAVSLRFYANEVVNVVESCGSCQVPILAISDSTLSPLAKNASVLFTVVSYRHCFPCVGLDANRDDPVQFFARGLKYRWRHLLPAVRTCATVTPRK